MDGKSIGDVGENCHAGIGKCRRTRRHGEHHGIDASWVSVVIGTEPVSAVAISV